MAKINEGPGSGSKNPLSNEYKIETELFKDDIDDMRGRTFGIEVVRGTLPKYTVGEKDAFDRDPKIDIGADPRAIENPESDVVKEKKSKIQV